MEKVSGLASSNFAMVALSMFLATILACAAATSSIDVESSASLVSVLHAPARPMVTASGSTASNRHG
jgi:hypothetical protein